jgi:hypothetical protein
MLTQQIIWLFILSIPIACIAWTVTHEEVFAEPRRYCLRQSRENKNYLIRKAFYLFTCEYCFSHYVTLFFLIITGYTLLLPGWKGYLIGGFALVWIANVYMSLFGLLRQAIKAEKTKIDLEEKIIESHEEQANGKQKTFNGKRTSLPKKMGVDDWKDM